MSEVDVDVEIKEKIKVKIAEPKNWKVILLNDETTPIDFVVSLLVDVFNHSLESAQAVTMQVHEDGSGIAGTYTFEIAEVKAIEATEVSRNAGHQLQIKLIEE